MLAIDIVFFLVELTVGLLVSSLALLADAFHMVRRIPEFPEPEFLWDNSPDKPP